MTHGETCLSTLEKATFAVTGEGCPLPTTLPEPSQHLPVHTGRKNLLFTRATQSSRFSFTNKTQRSLRGCITITLNPLEHPIGYSCGSCVLEPSLSFRVSTRARDCVGLGHGAGSSGGIYGLWLHGSNQSYQLPTTMRPIV